MKPYEILSTAIPRGRREQIARKLHVSAGRVGQWCREPLSDDAPTGTGDTSPLDRILDLIDAVFLENPAGAALVVEYIEAHHEALTHRHQSKQSDSELARTVLRECTDVVDAMLGGKTPDEIRREIYEAQAALGAKLIQLDQFDRPAKTFRRVG